MTIKLGIVMDPIQDIHYEKDSTLAMLWEAQERGWEIYYIEQKNLFLRDGVPYADTRRLQVFRDPTCWFECLNQQCIPLAECQVILMRKDPPFNEEYIYTTHLLEHVERLGTLVVNRPQALRDYNEKLFATYFPQCSPPALVTSSISKLRAFWQEHRDIVCKPLNSMGGASVFRIQENEVNANVIFETLTQNESCYIMAQRFISAIKEGDKRILIIDGEPVPHVLVRVPQKNDWRGNLAAGAKGMVQSLSEHDRWICSQVAPTLRAQGLYFVGLDIIGDYLTEINITSPTGIREIDAGSHVNVSALLMDVIAQRVRTHSQVT
ncbi:MAG: glutathione synthase [Gammaproteobacteria bacterium]|nr:glutathione synthase [Gammaproteobacteria bacterium]MCW5584075.1 glutathione synthase [Gammaproteobacteria bacterium]